MRPRSVSKNFVTMIKQAWTKGARPGHAKTARWMRGDGMFGKDNNGRDIVSMTAHEDRRFKAPLKMVEAYWQGLCGPNQVPLRSEVDPRGIESALENAFLVERIAPGMAKFRVTGSHISDLMGMQVAGMPVSTCISPEDRDRFGVAVTRLFADPAVIEAELWAESGFRKPDLVGHLILLPLRSDFGEVTRGLGAIVTKGRIGRTPRRFRLGDVSVRAAVTTSQPDPVTKPETKHPTPATGLAEPAKPFAPKAKAHLRLVVSND